jgi:hypothetical protein
MLYETQFLLALLTTWAIEIPILIVLIRYIFRENNFSIPRILGAGALCTALTLPYLWFVLPPYLEAAYYIPVGEMLVVLVEALILNKVLGLNPKIALVCSIIMNSASYFLGSFLL